MSHTEYSGGVWPPQGWEQFKGIELLNDQTIHKDPISSIVSGLCYKIEPIPVFKKKTRTYIYNVTIERWEYSINNESREVPILSFLLAETKPMAIPMARQLVIEDIKALSRPIKSTAKSTYRVLSAALFLMDQINQDKVPDIEKTLKDYKLHPSQSRRQQLALQVSKNNGLVNALPFGTGSMTKDEKAG